MKYFVNSNIGPYVLASGYNYNDKTEIEKQIDIECAHLQFTRERMSTTWRLHLVTQSHRYIKVEI